MFTFHVGVAVEDIANDAGSNGFDSRAGNIGRNVVYGSSPLLYYFAAVLAIAELCNHFLDSLVLSSKCSIRFYNFVYSILCKLLLHIHYSFQIYFRNSRF